MNAKKLGEILIEQGSIDAATLRAALDVQAGEPGSKWLGAILVEMGAINDESVARGISSQSGFAYVDPLKQAIDARLVAKVPRELSERHVLLPLDREEDGVRVAMVDPKAVGAIQEIEFLLHGRVKPMVASASAIRQAIHRHYDMNPEAGRLLRGAERFARGASAGPHALEIDAEALKTQLKAGGTQPYVRLLNYLLVNAIERRASDIHIEPGQDGVRIRFRVDGMLRDVLSLPEWADGPLVTRIKAVAELDVSVHRRPQDGKVSILLGDRRIDMRVAILPSQFGEKVTLRLLDPEMLVTDLGVMGWQTRALSAYYRMVSSPQGLVLVVGPTGSGKSTTLYGTIARLRAEATSICSIEDPIEYTLAGISQIQVDEKNHFGFANAIRSLLRQDPNVIVVGEIRDLETAKAAIEASIAGHLVLSTLHTSQSVKAIVRLAELGLPPYLMSSALIGVVAQRLLRRVCEACGVRSSIEREEWQRLGVAPMDLGPAVRRAGPGCARCQYAGYRGRVGVYEVLQVGEELRSLIHSSADEDSLWTEARREGLTTLLDDALLKVHQGITSLEEVARVVPIDPWKKAAPTESMIGSAAPWRPLWAAEGIDRALTGLIAVGGSVSNDLGPPIASGEPRFESQLPTPVEVPLDAEPVPEAVGAKVLVVDDADEIRQLVRLALEDEFEIDVAADGQEALEKVASFNPDLLVLDVMMPRLSGYDVCLRLKDDPKTAHIAVLMLSARGEKQAVAKGFYAGADDYLPKPFDPEELILRIKALLRRSRRARPPQG